MKKLVLTIAVALTVLAASETASAKTHHHYRAHHHHGAHHRRHGSGRHVTDGSGFIRGHNICALNVSKWLREHGKKISTASSKAFLSFVKVAKTSVHYGDVRFNYRRGGGHVQVVLGWSGGSLWCLNPSSRHQTWVKKTCPVGGTYLHVG